MSKLHNCVAGLIAAILMMSCLPASAQGIQDPTDWKFSIKKKDATHYTLIANTTIQPKWHIYGTTPGGDGTLIGTSFEFDSESAKAGEVTELTPAEQATLMDEKVNLHSGKATFSVLVSGKKGQVVSGSVEYQACNDMMCLPPKKKKFSLKLP